MDLAAATPVAIDTALADIYGRMIDVQVRMARVQRSVDDTVAGLARKAEGDFRYSSYSQETLDRLQAQVDSLCADLDALDAEQAPFNDEFARRGGWTRAFLVDNTNGHVHSSMACTTCFDTTQYGWLTQYSDHDESEIVAAAGEKACTVCYPTAPVDVLRRKSVIELPERRAARLAREAAKAERDAAKAAKALLPDGGAIRTQYQTLTTLTAAKMWLTNAAEYRWNHPGFTPFAEQVVAAVAAKTGETAEMVMAAADKRAAKRR